MDIAIGVIITVIFLAFVKIRYSYGAFKIWTNKKPRFVWFPKYLVSYSQPVSEIYAALERNGFEKVKSDGNCFKRGKVYGDFSAKHILLYVDINEENQQFKLSAKSFVFFDTGDLWRVSEQIRSGESS